MAHIKCNNSTSKSVTFFKNGEISIIVVAEQDGEYWFTIGHFKTLAGAKRSTIKQMARLGYTFDEKKMKAFTL